ncbi:MAG: hypothetical protein M1818_002528 [Claussenomyces sp. TS43310]|nr:MAG: hypothetical protein M1818_002528 [Claussenomyces sp. TS43310]
MSLESNEYEVEDEDGNFWYRGGGPVSETKRSSPYDTDLPRRTNSHVRSDESPAYRPSSGTRQHRDSTAHDLDDNENEYTRSSRNHTDPPIYAPCPSQHEPRSTQTLYHLRHEVYNSTHHEQPHRSFTQRGFNDERTGTVRDARTAALPANEHAPRPFQLQVEVRGASRCSGPHRPSARAGVPRAESMGPSRLSSRNTSGELHDDSRGPSASQYVVREAHYRPSSADRAYVIRDAHYREPAASGDRTTSRPRRPGGGYEYEVCYIKFGRR